MAWSVADLSVITADLVAMLNGAIATTTIFNQGPNGPQKFQITVSGSMPAEVRTLGGCQLSLYLLHINRDPTWRNTPTADWKTTPPANSLPRTNRSQPLALNLSYVLTAFAGPNSDQEQQAMSIALGCFHEQAIYKTPAREYTITVEADTIDEMSRLWQAMATPIRLSALFRVGVVFLQPTQPPPVQHAPPTKATISVGTALSAQSSSPQLFQAALQVTYSVAPPVAGQAPVVTGSPAAGTIVGGARVRVGGVTLDGPAATVVYLAQPTGARWTATAWRLPPVAPATAVSPDEIVLDFPAAYAALPAANAPLDATPPPGVYLLSVGDATGPRSVPIPVAIGPAIGAGVASPLQPSGTGVYTVKGTGFASGATRVTLDAIDLIAAPAAPAAGRFSVNAAGTQIRFVAPVPALAKGTHFLRIWVNGIEATTPMWIVLP